MGTKKSNQAFIDGNNLYLATTKCTIPWKIDSRRFRVYLEQKYRVDKAYYFLGCYDQKYADLYTRLQEHDFILMFREHGKNLATKKKGNVDVDIVFSIMQKVYEDETLRKVVLVSGDGDYRRMVDYLIENDRLQKVLLPCREHASSLYKKLGSRYYDYLDSPALRMKIGYYNK